MGLEANGVPIIGTSPEAIDRAEDRERFQQMVNKLGLKQPANATVSNMEQALAKAEEIGFPLVVRPSYVLGGRAMEIVYDLKDLKRYLNCLTTHRYCWTASWTTLSKSISMQYATVRT